MFQTLAAIFFTFALIAPVAVIALTLSGNGRRIATALAGSGGRAPDVAVRQVCQLRAANAGKASRTVSRPVSRRFQPVRAAA